ncbi:MAG: glycosyltransferase family 4 protein [Ilumatobacteraceae bacterium]
MAPRAVVWLTNIPTPYRHHQFATLHTAFTELGIDFRVLFMGEREPHRPWTYRAEDANYPHEVLPGRLTYVRGRPMHTNPAVIARLRGMRDTPHVLMIGGLSNPTAWMATFARSRRSSTLVLGIESNGQSEVLRHGPAAWWKRRLIRAADAFYIPGAASKDYVLGHDSRAAAKPWIVLPNIVDEAQFPPRADAASAAIRARRRAQLGVGPDVRVVLIPARLERFKGVLDVVQAVASLSRDSTVHVAFAGSGSLDGEIRPLLIDRPATLIGQVPDAEMHEWYAAADVMMLPSHRDASPLATVEALRSGLPLALSDAVGNACDALGDETPDEVNGWLFPSGDVPAIAALLHTISVTPDATLTAMGQRSEQLHAARFASTAVARHAAHEFAALIPAANAG